MEDDDDWDEDDWYDDDDDIIWDDCVSSFSLCCGAKQAYIEDFKDDFSDLTEDNAIKFWQDKLAQYEIGIMFFNKPYKGLTELIPGLCWYVAGGLWDRIEPVEIPIDPNQAPWHWWSLVNSDLFDNDKLTILANFWYGPVDIRANIQKTLDKTRWTLSILREDQRNWFHDQLMEFGFKEIEHFINPQHDTKLTLYLRSPDA